MWFVSQSAHTNRRQHQFLIFNRFSTYNFFLRFALCRRFSVYKPARNPCKFHSLILARARSSNSKEQTLPNRLLIHHLNAYTGTPTHRHCFIRLAADYFKYYHKNLQLTEKPIRIHRLCQCQAYCNRFASCTQTVCRSVYNFCNVTYQWQNYGHLFCMYRLLSRCNFSSLLCPAF